MKNKIRYTVFSFFFLFNVSAQEPELILPSANSNQMQALALSRDEKLAASADLDGKVKIWEVESGKLLKTLARTNLYDLAFTTDNKSLIITSFNPTEIYTIETGKSVIIGSRKYAEGMDLSPDGNWLAIGGDGMIEVWNMKTLKMQTSFESINHGLDPKFSPDSKTLAFFGSQTIDLYSVEKFALLRSLIGHTRRVIRIEFSKDNLQLLSAGDDSTARLWDIKSGKQLVNYTGHTQTVWEARFHPDNKSVITVASDNTGKIWDKNSGKLLQTLTGHKEWVYRVMISPNGKKFVMADGEGVGTVWDATTNKKLYTFRPGNETFMYLAFFRNGTQLLTGTYDPVLSRWNLETGKKELDYGLHNDRLVDLALSHDEKSVLVVSRDGYLRKIDAISGKVIFTRQVFKGGNWATSADFNTDDSRIVVSGGRFSSVLFNAAGGYEETVNDFSQSYSSSSKFSPDGKYLLHDDNFSVQLIRVSDNRRLLTIDSISMFTQHRFSPDGKYIIAGGNKRIGIWSVSTQRIEQLVNVSSDFPDNIEISFDSKYFLNVNDDEGTADIYERATGKLAATLSNIQYASFSPVENSLYIVAPDGEISRYSIVEGQKTLVGKIQDFPKAVNHFFLRNYEILLQKSASRIIAYHIKSGKKLTEITGEEFVSGQSGKYLYVLNEDNMEVWDMQTWKRLYRQYTVNEEDYLVQDDKGRYDGTEAARKNLYFVCGKEIIELEQAKDQLWVPDLAQRIMANDQINAKTIGNLNICFLSPEVENTISADAWHFKIKPRRGGLGETVLMVNGIEAKRYKVTDLKKMSGYYELSVRKQELENFFAKGKENIVSIKAYTTDNSISSRGLIVKENKSKETAPPPNLYAVMVGVSDYKGGDLDLKFAAKDATDISAAIGAAAKKLLETDGQPHVFMYNLTTNKERYQLPEKASIKKLMEEIGKKATANDILLIFFAGHGVMAGTGDKKQFYFLTADASTLSTTSAVKDVGISTAELIDWMKPQTIKAQKRILIFDACNSGQAINDIAGKDLAVRNDDKAQQMKAIDKLNEKSGLFILSASASDQSAYEMGRYSQGLLTYALLKAIKQQPEILNDGKFLDVSKWFSAAEQSVAELARETGARQEPQVVSNTNFAIGLVDQEVMSKIVLPMEKPMFAASNFQNSDEAIADDDLEISKHVNIQLADMASARGADSKIIYVTATNSPDAYTLTGRYTLNGENLTLTVNLKQNKVIKNKFEVKGTKDKLAELAATVAARAAELVK